MQLHVCDMFLRSHDFTCRSITTPPWNFHVHLFCHQIFPRTDFYIQWWAISRFVVRVFFQTGHDGRFIEPCADDNGHLPFTQ